MSKLLSPAQEAYVDFAAAAAQFVADVHNGTVSFDRYRMAAAEHACKRWQDELLKEAQS